MSEAKICIALPQNDFDPTEVSVPWSVFTKAGIRVDVATVTGQPGLVDPLLITGVIFGQLGAKPDALKLFEEMTNSAEFKNPIKYEDLSPDAYQALILPGGHAQGMKSYLESEALQKVVVAFMNADRTVGSICHGGLVLARSIDPKTGKSVIYNRNVTALTAALERTAYFLTAWKMGRYYRTYDKYVQQEMEDALEKTGSFQCGPLFASYGSPFFVKDGNLITARWPGDASGWAQALLERVKEKMQK